MPSNSRSYATSRPYAAGGIGLRLETGDGADVTGVRFVNVIVTTMSSNTLAETEGGGGGGGSGGGDSNGGSGGDQMVHHTEPPLSGAEPAGVETLESGDDDTGKLAGLLGVGGERIDLRSTPNDWKDRQSAAGDGQQFLNEVVEKVVMAVSDPPPPLVVAMAAGPGTGDEKESAGLMSCAGQALGAQDVVSLPRLPAGCLMRDPNIVD